MTTPKPLIPRRGIPARPMLKILIPYAKAKNLPFNMRNWEDVMRCFHYYCIHESLKN